MIRKTNLTSGPVFGVHYKPWKAIADLIYAYRKDWKTLDDLSEDLRIEPEILRESHKESLEFIALYYKSAHVKRVLSRFIAG